MDLWRNSEPIGEHFVQVCTTTPCMLRGAYGILDSACQALGGVKPGDTTKDGKFTIIEVECQGACSNAPMMVVGDDFYVRPHSITTSLSIPCRRDPPPRVPALTLLLCICGRRRTSHPKRPRPSSRRSRRARSQNQVLSPDGIRARTRRVSRLLRRRCVVYSNLIRS